MAIQILNPDSLVSYLRILTHYSMIYDSRFYLRSLPDCAILSGIFNLQTCLA
jgi:hypothetical protein